MAKNDNVKDGLETERKTLLAMLEIYCVDNHGGGEGQLCSDCGQLWEYAQERLGKCPFGTAKGKCSHCRVHCYTPEMRQRVVEVMRYSGPRMLKKHPILAVRHLAKRWKKDQRPEKQ